MEISEVFKIAEKQLNQTNTELEFKKVNEDEKSITFAGEKGAYRIAYDMQASTMNAAMITRQTSRSLKQFHARFTMPKLIMKKMQKVSAMKSTMKYQAFSRQENK